MSENIRKQIIKKYRIIIGPKVIGGNVENVGSRVVAKIKSALAEISYDPDICKVRIVSCPCYSYYSGHGHEYNIVITRPETDEEFSARINAEKEKRQRTIAKALAHKKAQKEQAALTRSQVAKNNAAKAEKEKREERQVLRFLMDKYNIKECK